MKLRCCGLMLLLCSAFLFFGCGVAHDSRSIEAPVSLDTLDEALSERDELERMYQLTRFLRTLGPEDVLGALKVVEKHRVGVTAEEVRLFMLAWTRVDAPGAFAAARDWPTPWKTVLMEQAMRAWGFNDGKAALAECERVEDEELRNRLRSALLEGWVSSHDRLGASEFVASIPERRRRNRLAFRLAGEAMRDGPGAVIAWAEAVPTDAPNEFKKFALYHAAGAVARVDPERVVLFYERHMEHGYSSTALRNIAIKWSEHHGAQELIAWVQSLPIEEARESERAEAIGVAVRTWAPEAPEEVAAWLESNLPNPAFDHAVAEFARAMSDTSPEVAVAWAARIEDETERHKYTVRAARKWLRQAPEAARTWAAGADLPEDWRQQILAKPPRPQRDPNAKRGPGRGKAQRNPGRG